MADNPFQGDAIKLGGQEDTWRRRVGSYRIIFDVDRAARSIVVIEIVRTSTTY
jgi:mRNA-degrading endonuclease RelE of RelBE toxin-antitoxin system